MRLIPNAQRILLIVLATAVAGCGANSPSGAQPSPTPAGTSPAVTPSGTSSASPTPTTPSPTATTPSTEWTVISSRVAYTWAWPGGDPGARVFHTSSGQLIRIGVGDHPNDPGDRPYNRMSFTFTTGYPSYRFQYVSQLVADGSGQPIPLEGQGVLRIVFNPAQAHTIDGTASTILSRPPAHLGLSRMASYAAAGDFEGYLSFGVGIAYPIQQSNPQIAVRVVEVTYANAQGQHRYVVGFDVDAT